MEPSYRLAKNPAPAISLTFHSQKADIAIMESFSFPARRYVARYPGTVSPKYPGEHAEPKKILLSEEQYVLIVDDDPFFRSLLRVMLGQTGWPIAGIRDAEDSLTACKICAAEPVSLVFCDLNLAKYQSESGLEVIRELRSTHPRMPIVMVTAENSETVVREVRAAGATGHLLKPVNLRSLKSIFTC
jgi:CheY-like chemotaxis protein